MIEPVAVVQRASPFDSVTLLTLALAGVVLLLTGNTKLAGAILLSGATYEFLRYEGVVRWAP